MIIEGLCEWDGCLLKGRMDGTSLLSLSATLRVRGFKNLVEEKSERSFTSDDAENVIHFSLPPQPEVTSFLSASRKHWGERIDERELRSASWGWGASSRKWLEGRWVRVVSLGSLGCCCRHGRPRPPLPLLLHRGRFQLWQLRGLRQCAHPNGYILPTPSPPPRPGLCGPPCAEPDVLSASGGGFQLPPAAPPGAGLAGGARVPQGFRAKPCFPLPAPAPRAPRKSAVPREVGRSARLAPPALPGRARLRRGVVVP